MRKRIGKEVLNEIYGIYHRVEDIALAKLPKCFVLKVTHGSGQNIICKDKNAIDWKFTSKTLKCYLNANHYFHYREWAYKNIPPRVICEKYMQENGEPPKDYKILCFNGEPGMIEVDTDRFAGHKRNLYDLNWNLIDVEYGFPRIKTDIDKPRRLSDMLQYARSLAKGIPFVRVDFYCIKDKIVFGEMTFYPQGGSCKFDPIEYNRRFGSLLQLPVISA